MLRFIGGSDCWRVLLMSSGLTRLVAAKESLSSGRSSLAESVIFLISDPANPVNAFCLSEAATRRAFPR